MGFQEKLLKTLKKHVSFHPIFEVLLKRDCVSSLFKNVIILNFLNPHLNSEPLRCKINRFLEKIHGFAMVPSRKSRIAFFEKLEITLLICPKHTKNTHKN